MPSGDPVFSESQSSLGSGSLPQEHLASTEAVNPETGDAPSTPVQGSQFNWEDPSNPYIARYQDMDTRFKGLQGTVQQRTEELRSVREQLNQMQQQQFMDRIRNLDPMSQQREIVQYQERQQLDQERQRLQEVVASNEALARMALPIVLSQKYGIPASELANLETPEQMQAKAEAYKQYAGQFQAQSNQVQRQVNNADNFPPTERSAAIPRQKTTDWGQASDSFNQELKRLLR